MVRCNKPPRRVLVKIKVVYKPKASCIVLPPADRLNLAQFCALLMTIEKQLKIKKESDMHDPVQQSKSRIKGSRNCEPFLFCYFSSSLLSSCLKYIFKFSLLSNNAFFLFRNVANNCLKYTKETSPLIKSKSIISFIK